ncbi:MAG TPA: DUF998 domain-containing protein [Puia sp.]|nr:DUF998 domain-containing protein [Puia sp.]
MRKKIGLIALLISTCLVSFSQQKLPTLLSDSNSVSIKIDGNTVAVWNINADTRPWTEPDIFTIDRSFREQHVTYLSNGDSLMFTVKPGDSYDFTIAIKNRGNYLMRLTTFGEPVIQHKNITIIIFLLLIVITWISWSKRKTFGTISLLYLGIITPLLFWLMTITGGFMHGNYNHLHNVVSELGALGTRSEIFMSIGEILIAVLSLYAVFGYTKACRQIGLNLIPVLTMLSVSFSMFWAAIFPMHHVLHGIMGPLPLILNAGVLLSIFLWRGKKFQTLRIFSLISFILMMLILFRIIPDLRGRWEGLLQRTFYLGWTVWSIALSLIFIQFIEIRNRQ